MSKHSFVLSEKLAIYNVLYLKKRNLVNEAIRYYTNLDFFLLDNLPKYIHDTKFFSSCKRSG